MTSLTSDEASILTPEERKRLHQRCIDVRVENEKYLRTHPELNMVLGEAVRLLLIHRPDAPVAFLEDFLATMDLNGLAEKLMKEKVGKTL
jgi:hypothetical protein